MTEWGIYSVMNLNVFSVLLNLNVNLRIFVRVQLIAIFQNYIKQDKARTELFTFLPEKKEKKLTI